jgi:signal transduction histidine kinase
MISGDKAARHAVTIVTELQEGMPAVAYDPHRLQQALLNLLNNALEASPQGGEVVLRRQVKGHASP